MDKRLYFIPMLARALDGPNKVRALQEAIASIQKLGQDAAYQEGFQQFCGFMEAVGEAVVEGIRGDSDNGFSGETADEWPPASTVTSSPGPAAEAPSSPLARLAGSFTAKLFLDRDGRRVHEAQLQALPAQVSFADITPGRYVLRLSTGRILWEAVLQDSDLLWRLVRPEVPLALAASTDDADITAGAEFSLLEAEILLQLLPGIECGRLRIVLKGGTHGC